MDTSERLLSLLSFLLRAPGPVSSETILEAFPDAYSGQLGSQERKLSRDKEALRQLGVPIESVREEDRLGAVRVDRRAFYLSDVPFTAEERAALFAVGAEALRGAFPLHEELAHALTKLRTTRPDGEERAEPVVLSGGRASPEIEDVIARAASERRQLRLRYPPEQKDRVVDPYVFSARRGRFTVVGYCHLRRAIRTFYADQMTTCELANPKARTAEFEVPVDFNAAQHLPVHPWQIRSHPPVDVQLAFPPELEVSGPRALGIGPDGKVAATHLEGLISQLLALGPGVRIVSPASAATRLRERLRALKKSLEEPA
jgi:proteasome accessory factor B